jgi:hypothetical protein
MTGVGRLCLTDRCAPLVTLNVHMPYDWVPHETRQKAVSSSQSLTSESSILTDRSCRSKNAFPLPLQNKLNVHFHSYLTAHTDINLEFPMHRWSIDFGRNPDCAIGSPALVLHSGMGLPPAAVACMKDDENAAVYSPLHTAASCYQELAGSRPGRIRAIFFVPPRSCGVSGCQRLHVCSSVGLAAQ